MNHQLMADDPSAAGRRRVRRLVFIGIVALVLLGGLGGLVQRLFVDGHGVDDLRHAWDRERRFVESYRRAWDDKRRSWEQRRRAEEQARRQAASPATNGAAAGTGP